MNSVEMMLENHFFHLPILTMKFILSLSSLKLLRIANYEMKVSKDIISSAYNQIALNNENFSVFKISIDINFCKQMNQK